MLRCAFLSAYSFFRSFYIYTYNFSGYMTVVRSRWGQTFLDVATDFSAHGLGSALRRGRSPCQLIRWTSARSRTAWWWRLSVDSQGLPRRTPNKTAAIHLFHLLPSVWRVLIAAFTCISEHFSRYWSDRYHCAGGKLDDRVAIGSLDVARCTSSTAV